jgi:hypothetical protein
MVPVSVAGRVYVRATLAGIQQSADDAVNVLAPGCTLSYLINCRQPTAAEMDSIRSTVKRMYRPSHDSVEVHCDSVFDALVKHLDNYPVILFESSPEFDVDTTISRTWGAFDYGAPAAGYPRVLYIRAQLFPYYNETKLGNTGFHEGAHAALYPDSVQTLHPRTAGYLERICLKP